MLPTHDVPCPHCGAALYSAVSLDDGINPGAVESPDVHVDNAGFYMSCPKCRRRVAMERVGADNGKYYVRAAPAR
jgi:DNA-directed RNA polymerase subunit RPC12/RpoP